MLSEYDAVVVGAGPAGSMAAYEIAAAGFSVIILEKHERPGVPLACGEAVPRGSFERIMTPQKEWICAEINKATIIGPDGNKATAVYQNGGYILDRKKFDYYLATRAVEMGSTLACNCIGLELDGGNDKFNSIDILNKDGEKSRIEASVFIAADGVESKIARLAGIDNLVNIEKAEALLQYRLENIKVDPEMIVLYVGNEIAPGGYLYVFPKSENSANVGIGIITDSNRGKKLESLLNDFVEQKFKGAHIVEKVCGLTPKYLGEKMFRKDNLIIAGDAARALDSFSGAGVINALTSGRYAGLAAGEYLKGRIENNEDFDKLYPGRFLDERGEELSMYAKLKTVYLHLDDDDFTDVIKAMDKYLSANDARQINMIKLLIGILISRPRLVRLVRYLM